MFSYPLLVSIEAVSAEIGSVNGGSVVRNRWRHYPH